MSEEPCKACRSTVVRLGGEPCVLDERGYCQRMACAHASELAGRLAEAESQSTAEALTEATTKLAREANFLANEIQNIRLLGIRR